MRKPYYDGDAVNSLIDAAYFGRISRRTFFRALIAAGFTAAAARDMAEQAAQAQANQASAARKSEERIRLHRCRRGLVGLRHGASAVAGRTRERPGDRGRRHQSRPGQDPRSAHLYAEFRHRYRLGLQVDAAEAPQQPRDRGAGRPDHRRRFEHQRDSLAQGRQGRLRPMGGGGRVELVLQPTSYRSSRRSSATPAARPRSAAEAA